MTEYSKYITPKYLAQAGAAAALLTAGYLMLREDSPIQIPIPIVSYAASPTPTEERFTAIEDETLQIGEFERIILLGDSTIRLTLPEENDYLSAGRAIIIYPRNIPKELDPGKGQMLGIADPELDNLTIFTSSRRAQGNAVIARVVIGYSDEPTPRDEWISTEIEVNFDEQQTLAVRWRNSVITQVELNRKPLQRQLPSVPTTKI